MMFLFYVVVFGGAFFFVLVRRQFDFVSSGFFGAVVYFMPGFVGRVFNPYLIGELPIEPVAFATYAVWIAALIAFIITGFIYNPDPADRPFTELRTTQGMDFALLATVVLAFLLTATVGGDDLYNPDKNEVLATLSRYFLLFSSVSQIALVAFVIQRKWLLALAPAVAVAFIIYVGFRLELAIATIVIATYFARRNGIRVFFRPRYLFPVLTLGFFILSYKSIFEFVKLGRFDLVTGRVSDEGFFTSVFGKSEPFTTQTILNEVLQQNYGIDSVSILYSLLTFIPLATTVLGLPDQALAFNFQDQLFPNLQYGVASNIYAHFYATLGVFGLALFISLHCAALVKLSQAMSSSRGPCTRLALLMIGGFIAFYIHRNDLAFSINIVTRYVYTTLLLWLVSKVFEALVPDSGRKTTGVASAIVD